MDWGWRFVPFGIFPFFALQRYILNLELISNFADTYLCGLSVRGADFKVVHMAFLRARTQRKLPKNKHIFSETKDKVKK